MLLPKRTKYRKQFRGRMRGDAKGGDYVAFGDYGLVAMEPAWVKSNQIEACRIVQDLKGFEQPAGEHAGKTPREVFINNVIAHETTTVRPRFDFVIFLVERRFWLGVRS